MATTFRSKKESVYRHLRAALMTVAIQPGERIIIQHWAGRLNVSQIPIREALIQLEHDGLVTVEPYVGARAADLSLSMIEEVFALLEAQSVVGVRLACQRYREEEFAAIERALVEMNQHGDDSEPWLATDSRFHVMISQLAGTALTPRMLSKVYDQWQRLHNCFFDGQLSVPIAEEQADHTRIVAAIRARDVERAEQLVCDHVHRAKRQYLDHLATAEPTLPERRQPSLLEMSQ